MQCTGWRNEVGNTREELKAPHENSANNMLKLAHTIAIQITLSLATLLHNGTMDSNSNRLVNVLDRSKSIIEAAAISPQGQWLLCCLYQDLNSHFGNVGEPAVGLLEEPRHAANSHDEMGKRTPGLQVMQLKAFPPFE